MPPRKKLDVPAAKAASPPRPQISDLRRAAEGGTAFPRPAPSEAMASEENSDNRARATDNVTTPWDSARGHPGRSGERSAATGRTPGAEGGRGGTRSEAREGSKRKSSASSPQRPGRGQGSDAVPAQRRRSQDLPSLESARRSSPRLRRRWSKARSDLGPHCRRPCD